MTYRQMWERHVEPVLKAQAELRRESGDGPVIPDDGPVTIDQKVAEAQAVGLMFGQDPLEVGKAVRKSWPPKPGDIEALRQKLLAREQKA